MAYTDTTKLYAQEPQANIIQLTDDANAGVVNTAYITQAIIDADALIDAYLYGHVNGWVLSPIPAIISEISTEITIYNLYLRRYGAGNTRSSMGLPEGIVQRYNDAVSKLKAIAKGEIIIGDTEKTFSSIQVLAPVQVFTTETLAGF
jgi:phage gp36-like protein